MKDQLHLGRLLGRHETLTAIGGRCTAEQVATMREVRDSKLYLGETKSFGEFCLKHFKTSKANANRLIQLLNEFGPAYFLVTQYTPIPGPVYRAIAPSVQENAIHHNGQAIALIPENAEKIVEAVHELRRTIKPAKPEPDDPVMQVEAQCKEALAAIESVIPLHVRRAHVRAIMHYVRERLRQLELTM